MYLVTDRRTYKDRRDVFAAEKKPTNIAPERPKAKIKHNEGVADRGSRKAKHAAKAEPVEEKTEVINHI